MAYKSFIVGLALTLISFAIEFGYGYFEAAG
jgi:hypothetical protein